MRSAKTCFLQRTRCVRNLTQTDIHSLSYQSRFQFSDFSKDFNKARLSPKTRSEADDKLRLEREETIDIHTDPRTSSHFPEIKVKGAKHRNSPKEFNRAGIEKKHAEYGWSKLDSRTSSQWNPKDNSNSKDFAFTNSTHWPNELTLVPPETQQGSGNHYNPNDLTTFESFSESSRLATFKAALNLGVHWGKEKKLWNASMAPYLKGVVDGRHVFDINLTISNLRKTIRLLQSLIMDECNILFVCNSKATEMRTLARIMCTRCNVPLLDSKWTPGSLTNWDWQSEHYRGPGRALTDGKRPSNSAWKKTKLHRMMRSPPDFIFLLNRGYNDILVHEANRVAVPVGSLCDSDDSTRDLQYVIPCNTQSIQSMHFILDCMTRGILEAKAKKDSLWWANEKDQEQDINALHDAEVEWQYKYDPYQRLRLAKQMMAGDIGDDDMNRNESDIATNYVESDENVLVEAAKSTPGDNTKKNNSIPIGMHGNVNLRHKKQENDAHIPHSNVSMGTNIGLNDEIEDNRQEKLMHVLNHKSSEYNRKYQEKIIGDNDDGESDNKSDYIEKFDLPKQFQTTSQFAIQMLTDHVQNKSKYRDKQKMRNQQNYYRK